MKLLCNKYEKVTYEQLKELCDGNGTHVFTKVRMADALPIAGSGIADHEFSFALKSHLDFLVTDRGSEVLFAVEFDGPQHVRDPQKRRDAIKDSLCEHFGLPLLRINSNYLKRQFRQFNLLTYFVELWFLNAAFDEAQAQGIVPWDEGFDPVSIISDGSGQKWPYWLSRDIQSGVARLHKQGLVGDPSISHWVGVDKEGSYRCLAWIGMPDGRFVIVQTGMRAQRFPVCESDVIAQLADFDVHAKLMDVLSGRSRTEPAEVRIAKLKDYTLRYDLRCLHFCGRE